MRSSKQAFLSVVTPFYNTEAFLEDCIKSVLNQSHDNFEYILVDNCSTDRSAEIANRYAESDSRIRLLKNRTFLRQCENYNRALRAISEESLYCKIVEADNWIYPNCLSEMLNIGEANPSVGIVGAYTLLDFGTHANVYLTGLPYPSTVVKGTELCRRFLLDGTDVTGTPSATLLRSEIVRSRNPFYDARSVVPDVEVCFNILQSWDFGFVHQVLTYTRRYNDSWMSVLKHLNLQTLAELIAIRKYGVLFLNSEEYARRSRHIERKYHRALGENVLRGMPTPFWDLQRHVLSNIGEELHWLQLITWGTVAAFNLALNPKQTAERLLNYASKVGGKNFDKIDKYFDINQSSSKLPVDP